MYPAKLILCLTFTIHLVLTSKLAHIPLFPVYNWNFINNNAIVDEGYYINLDFGTPEQRFNILLDTGSSNLAIAAIPNVHLDTYFHYNRSTTFHTNNQKLIVNYTVGSWQGFLATELISVPSNPPLVVNTNIACIESETNFFSNSSVWQGILGMAYAKIAKPPSLVPFFDSLVKTKDLNNIFSLHTCGPFATMAGSNGELVLGGIDEKLYSGNIVFTPIYQEWYYEVILMNMKIGNDSWPYECFKLNTNHTIIDTGSSNFVVPQPAFDWIIEKIKRNTMMLEIPDDFWYRKTEVCLFDEEVDLFPDLRLYLAQKEKQTFSLVITSEMYLQKSSNERKPCYYFSIELGSKETVIGAAILKGFYVVFDRENKRIGFANGTCFTKYSKFIAMVTASEETSKTSEDCMYFPNKHGAETGIKIVSYVVAFICLICAIPLLIMLMRWIWVHLICPKIDSSENSSLVEGSQ
ncbi:beta-secretase 1-like [Centruroides vittatus]|uniref:beta-secretase 1-like n=1 Tax=Centruroides vittatus TaxID=120091 RepID=UPI00350F0577